MVVPSCKANSKMKMKRTPNKRAFTLCLWYYIYCAIVPAEIMSSISKKSWVGQSFI